MYLGLEKPWRSTPARVAAVTPDPGSGSGSGSGSAAKKKKKRRGGGGGGDNSGGDVGDAEEYEESEPIVLTAGDRKLEWRGDEVSLPPKILDMEDNKEARALDDGEIGAVISRRGSGVIDCIVRAATGTDLVATVTLKLAVDGNGKVGKLRVQAPHYLFEQGLLSCVRRAAGKFDFPATGAGTLVTAPFELGG
jgi:hypothetical protein